MFPEAATGQADDPSSAAVNGAQARIVDAFLSGQLVEDDVRHVETHLSHVFLSGDRAWKVFKPVSMPFVNLTQLADRRANCDREIAANTSLAGDLYLGVEPIVARPDGSLKFGGEGAALDYAVVMRRFDEALQFDHLAERGELDVVLVEETARRIAAFHAEIPSNSRAGHTADYRGIIKGLRKTEADGAHRLGIEPGSADLFDALDRELAHVSPLIEARRKAGKVKRGHGDLHLRNICLFQGRATPFDALEFDDRLATADLIYDVAFLLTDLMRIGLTLHANAVLNAYWDAAEDDEQALALLPVFMALRAAVQMAVGVEAGDLERADTFRRLGLSFLARREPVLFAVGGLSGTGKSTVAKALAPELPGPAGARLLRTDVIRKRMLRIAQFEAADDAAYTPERRADVYRVFTERARAAMTAGASVVADATFRVATTRDAIEAAASDADFLGAWLEAPLAVRIARVAARGSDASDADVSVASQQREPNGLSPAWRRVDARGDVETTVSNLLALHV